MSLPRLTRKFSKKLTIGSKSLKEVSDNTSQEDIKRTDSVKKKSKLLKPPGYITENLERYYLFEDPFLSSKSSSSVSVISQYAEEHDFEINFSDSLDNRCVYLSLILYAHDGKILVNSKNILPSVLLTDDDYFHENFNCNSKEFYWMKQLSLSWQEAEKDFSGLKENSELGLIYQCENKISNKLISNFVKGVRMMKTVLKLSNLGYMWDRLNKLADGTKVVTLVVHSDYTSEVFRFLIQE
jgi:hypothetical protein